VEIKVNVDNPSNTGNSMGEWKLHIKGTSITRPKFADGKHIGNERRVMPDGSKSASEPSYTITHRALEVWWVWYD
tara:strand:- start:210 stop:434 length:225 start_codon:yes stop_codon:yes gene_type:complete